MSTIKAPESIFELPTSLVAQMISLATSGFGVVVALAWNEVIKSTIDTYVKPHLGQGSGVISLLIYAIVVTALAVLVTMQLSKLQKTVENFPKKVGKKSAGVKVVVMKSKKVKSKTTKVSKSAKKMAKKADKRGRKAGK
jgi:hypothetical protein